MFNSSHNSYNPPDCAFQVRSSPKCQIICNWYLHFMICRKWRFNIQLTASPPSFVRPPTHIMTTIIPIQLYVHTISSSLPSTFKAGQTESTTTENWPLKPFIACLVPSAACCPVVIGGNVTIWKDGWLVSANVIFHHRSHSQRTLFVFFFFFYPINPYLLVFIICILFVHHIERVWDYCSVWVAVLFIFSLPWPRSTNFGAELYYVVVAILPRSLWPAPHSPTKDDWEEGEKKSTDKY